jgi:hypothetical protein
MLVDGRHCGFAIREPHAAGPGLRFAPAGLRPLNVLIYKRPNVRGRIAMINIAQLASCTNCGEVSVKRNNMTMQVR